MIKKAIKKWLGINYLEREAEWNKKHLDNTLKALTVIKDTLQAIVDNCTQNTEDK